MSHKYKESINASRWKTQKTIKLIQDLRENLGDFEFTDDCLDVQLTKEKTQYIKDKINRIKKATD